METFLAHHFLPFSQIALLASAVIVCWYASDWTFPFLCRPDVTDLHQIRWSTGFQALKFRNVRSGSHNNSVYLLVDYSFKDGRRERETRDRCRRPLGRILSLRTRRWPDAIKIKSRQYVTPTKLIDFRQMNLWHICVEIKDACELNGNGSQQIAWAIIHDLFSVN